MKEKTSATTSLLKRILVNCSAQAKQYGSCVASRVPEVEKDMCSKEFLVLRSCMQSVVCFLLSSYPGCNRIVPKFSCIIVEDKLSKMIGEASSNALSHVYIKYPPLRCHVHGTRSLFYDDGNKLMLSLTSNQVFSWKTAPYDPHVAPSSDPISEGPVLSIRYSLDLKLLAIQRSKHEIQIWNKETGDTFSQKYRPASESILGFFWTDCPTSDIVFVRTNGLEFYSYNTETKSLQLSETKKLNVSWYIYTHESRLVLLATGMQSKSFTGYQLSSAGIIRLPRFEMAIAKSEANNKPIVAAEDVHIITVYGKIYCLQFDRVAMLLHLYRFYRDAVVQQGSLPIYSSKIAVSVVDNTLLVHQVEAKVVIIYDMFADSQAPISAPLPLLLRGLSRTNLASCQSTSTSSIPSESKNLSDTEVAIYGEQWNFLVPDLVCDVSNGFLWKVHVDLEAVSASSSEVSLMLEFLQRRKMEAYKAKQLCLSILRSMILERKPVAMVARAIDVLLTTYSHALKTGSYHKRPKAEEASSSGISNITGPIRIDESGKSIKQVPESSIENESYSRSALSTSDSDGSTKSSKAPPSGQSQIHEPGNDQLNTSASEQQESQLTSAATSPEDLHKFVFAPGEEEMAGDGSYLAAIIIEFLRSASSEKLKVHPNTYVLMIQILARDERYADLGLFVTNKIIEPSKEVAMQLLESGRQNLQIRKLGLGMLRQLSFHHDYVLLLVQDGYYLEALRYARKNKVNTVRPSLFLESAYASKDPQHLTAVLRFFSDFIPGFKNTSDHHTYLRIIAEMNTSIAA